MKCRCVCLFVLSATLAAACTSDGTGTAAFTTYGEDFIEKMIPADATGQSGFVDGWSLKYDKFLVAFSGITIADDKGTTARMWTGSKLVDNVKPGRKDLVSFHDVDARAWNRVSYVIRPPVAATELVGATDTDLTMMISKGHSVYVAGSASKGAVTKTFRWGFSTATLYRDCQQAEESGKATVGIVVKSGGTDTSELTTHGDHLFYDRLRASADVAIKTSLRFEEKAAADKDNDGEITLDELLAAPIDVRTYDPSGLPAPNLGAFMTALVRTVGHFRGEGECAIAEAP